MQRLKLIQCCSGGPNCSSYFYYYYYPQLLLPVNNGRRSTRSVQSRSFKLLCLDGRKSFVSLFGTDQKRQLNILSNLPESTEKRNTLEMSVKKKESLSDIESGLTLREYTKEVHKLRKKSGWSFENVGMRSPTEHQKQTACDATAEVDEKMQRKLELKRRREQVRNAPNSKGGRPSAHTLFGRGLMEMNEFDPMEVFEAVRKDFYRRAKDSKPLSQTEKEEFFKEHDVLLSTQEIPDPCMAMDDLILPTVLKTKLRQNLDKLMPIQSVSWPILLSGKNMLGIAPTGSGKSLGFMIPGLIHCGGQETITEERAPTMLIISPTRELTEQLTDVTAKYEDTLSLTSYNCSGGLDRKCQERDGNRVNNILLGTPGRLMDFLRSEMFSLKKCSFVVLDEADRLLNMGFEPQIKTIFSYIRPDCQVSMFSATFNDEVEKLARQYIGGDEERVVARIGGGYDGLTVNKNIEQHVEVLHLKDRELRLVEVIQTHREMHGNQGKVLVFVKDGPTAEKLANDLSVQKGWETYAVYGELPQRKRQYRFGVFRYKAGTILLSTDVGARGLDITNIDLVVNFDFPMEMTDYVHRIGRTARGTRKGKAVSFISKRDMSLAKPLIELLGRTNQPVTGDLIRLKGKAGGMAPRSFGYRGGLSQYQYTNEDLPAPVMPPETEEAKIKKVKSETQQAEMIETAMNAMVADGEHRDNLRILSAAYEEKKFAAQWVQRKAVEDVLRRKAAAETDEVNLSADESVNLLTPGVLYLDPELYGDSYSSLSATPRLSYNEWARKERKRLAISDRKQAAAIMEVESKTIEQLEAGGATIENLNNTHTTSLTSSIKPNEGKTGTAIIAPCLRGRDGGGGRTAAEMARINADYQESLRTFKPKGSRKEKKYQARVERQQKQIRRLYDDNDGNNKDDTAAASKRRQSGLEDDSKRMTQRSGGSGSQFASEDREFVGRFAPPKGTATARNRKLKEPASEKEKAELLSAEERKQRLYVKGEYEENEKQFDLYEYEEWRGFKTTRDSAITRSKTPFKDSNVYPW